MTAAAVVILLLAVSSYGQVSVAPGITYREIKRTEIPWSIQVLEAYYRTPTLALGVELGGEHIIGIEPLNHLMERLLTAGHQAVAGVNGDFYILKAGPFQGDPIGFCVENGELLSSPINRLALVILEDGSLVPQGAYTFTVAEKHDGGSETSIPPDRIIFIGRGAGAEFLDGIEPGEPVECVLDVEPSPGTIRHAIGGGPRLLRNGEISIKVSEEGIAQSFVETSR